MLISTPYLTIDRPVTPVPALRQVVAERAKSEAPLAGSLERKSNAPTWDSLRKIRSEALAELESEGGYDENTTRYLSLDRDQLASMVFDRTATFGADERRSAWRQLQRNDEAFLSRANELADISGDERVLLNAQIELETLKLPIERALPKDAAAVNVAELTQRLSRKTAEFGGAPVSISLRYPSGWGAVGADRQAASDNAISKASPGAARVAQIYRESYF